VFSNRLAVSLVLLLMLTPMLDACSTSSTAPTDCAKQIADAKSTHGGYIQNGPTTQNSVTVETLFFPTYNLLAIFKWGDGISGCQETWENQ